MQKLHWSITINAPREKVWHTMLDDATYRQWTKAFDENSHYKGDWSQGSEILFLGPNENGKEGGMISQIAENRPNEFISIKHIGMIKDGVRDTTSDEVKKWTPAFENYTFTDKAGGTELTIGLDVAQEYKDMFEEMWPKALQKLKELAESNSQ